MSEEPHLKIAPTGTAPWRWLLVIVPAAILIGTTAKLVSDWSSRIAAPEPAQETTSRTPIWDEIFASPPANMPAPPPTPPAAERSFDAARVVAMLPAADLEAGANSIRMCSMCHSLERGAGHRLGPNLWNIVGRKKAGASDFYYSEALRGKGGAWTYEELATFLNNPRRVVPGTSMAFAGMIDERRLANVIAFLRTQSDKPVPLPD